MDIFKMRESEKRQKVIKIAWSYLGTFYKWGGDDPSGFDCSGLVIECLKSVGILPRRGDWTADNLWNKFRIKPANPREGDLVFWHTSGNFNRIIHIEICINEELSIGASGGGSLIKTEQDAIKHNAFIKIRPFDSRPSLRGFANPYV